MLRPSSERPSPSAVPAANRASIVKYSRVAQGYDASAGRTMRIRMRNIANLRLRPGDVVLDVGAGTGLSYPMLAEAVGDKGRVLAFEQCPQMFEQAERRRLALAQSGRCAPWHVCAMAETVRLPEPPDAVLFNYVHDISRSSSAVRNILSQVKPGARIAMAGMKYFPWWLAPLNLLAWAKNRPYNARPGDLTSPWDLVEPHCEDWHLEATQMGMGYLAWGTLRGGRR